jgi:gamma-glutamyl phosphate reductase
LTCIACTQEEVNRCIDSAKTAQKIWAKTPLWKRAEALHKVATILKEQKAPIADCLVKEVAKTSKDAVVEVLFYTLQPPTLFVHRVVIAGSTKVLPDSFFLVCPWPDPSFF